MKITLTSPAKINLYLKVLNKRSNGYHNIHSLIVPISLYDLITVTQSNKYSLSCTDTNVPINETNTVTRAINQLNTSFDLTIRDAITLEKNIPLEAGLGGGSSNAATILLHYGNQYKLPFHALLEIAATIGSDVSFFLYQQAAWVTGRGEIVEPLAREKKFNAIIVNSGVRISTRWAYHELKIELTNPMNNYKIVESKIYGESSFGWINHLHNDFEDVVFKAYPGLAKIKNEILTQGALAAQLSGSGGCLFGICPEKEIALRIANHFKTLGLNTYVVHALTKA